MRTRTRTVTTEVEPQVTPEPTEVKPEPTGVKPEPTEVKPEPTEVKPQPLLKAEPATSIGKKRSRPADDTGKAAKRQLVHPRPTEQECRSKYGGLPNTQCSSDHVSLMAEFQWGARQW